MTDALFFLSGFVLGFSVYVVFAAHRELRRIKTNRKNR